MNARAGCDLFYVLSAVAVLRNFENMIGERAVFPAANENRIFRLARQSAGVEGVRGQRLDIAVGVNFENLPFVIALGRPN